MSHRHQDLSPWLPWTDGNGPSVAVATSGLLRPDSAITMHMRDLGCLTGPWAQVLSGLAHGMHSDNFTSLFWLKQGINLRSLLAGRTQSSEITTQKFGMYVCVRYLHTHTQTRACICIHMLEIQLYIFVKIFKKYKGEKLKLQKDFIGLKKTIKHWLHYKIFHVSIEEKSLEIPKSNVNGGYLWEVKLNTG